MVGKGLISIWFFIGVILLIYGLIILPSSFIYYNGGGGQETVLANLHAGIWWGALLFIVGLIYTVRFFPRRRP